ncbi:CLUMA_CG016787, isoform A [Clunio marinus]|uniref:CLUMA_CG016787, isoform A n=1 Tax=Clunio marinus TaxID=568069 RepID=A0A1J1ISI7_9DIPT|nr:CLUMA_CG016787, isoform A [Clunio marinus]
MKRKIERRLRHLRKDFSKHIKKNQKFKINIDDAVKKSKSNKHKKRLTESFVRTFSSKSQKNSFEHLTDISSSNLACNVTKNRLLDHTQKLT